MRLRLRGWLKEGLVLVYRTPASGVADLVPGALELITHKGDAFWNVAVTQVEAVRPWGLPPWAGFDCAMVACGLHVSAQTSGGKEMLGLYLIRHDADPRFLWFLGKESMGFETHRARIEFAHKHNRLIVTVDSQEDNVGHAYLSVDLERPVSRPAESACTPAYPGILMSPDRWGSRVYFTETIQDSTFLWKPVHVQESRWNLFRDLDQEQAVLESAWRMEPAEFTWATGLTHDLEPAGVPYQVLESAGDPCPPYRVVSLSAGTRPAASRLAGTEAHDLQTRGHGGPRLQTTDYSKIFSAGMIVMFSALISMG